jgi:hypothetical protein
MPTIISILLMMAATLPAQQQKSARPNFRDFAIKQIYKGTPAKPKITKDWRTFRTRIRAGARSPVEFAGHYTVPRWGCGAGCIYFAIVDSITGTVYEGFSVADLSESWVDQHPEELQIQFHPNSRLFKVDGCIGEVKCGFYDYEMVDGKGLKLVREEPYREGAK